MRTLTIERRKTFVGCAMAMKVYIEDPDSTDLQINGVSCRLLGKVKNNQKAEFTIGEEAARVYVIADKLSKNICNEFYPIPEGNEDIYLSGKNYFDPFAGNPFYFDGVKDPEVLANRKKTKRKFFPVLIIAALVGGVAGFFVTSGIMDTVKPETFSSGGMQITLTSEFEETDMAGFTVCYDSRTAAVFALKESFTLMPGFGDYTLTEYGQLVLDANGFDSTVKLQTTDGLTWFDYVAEGNDGNDYYYFCVVYKSNDAFWLVQFTTPDGKAETMTDTFVQWAKSVTFE